MISLKDYYSQIKSLMDRGYYVDGCSVPFIKKWIHKYLKKSKFLCTGHDLGNLGYIKGIKPGLDNQFMSLYAHIMQKNPIYWIWGVIIFVFTMPWILWRRELNIRIMNPIDFHVIFLALCVMASVVIFVS